MASIRHLKIAALASGCAVILSGCASIGLPAPDPFGMFQSKPPEPAPAPQAQRPVDYLAPPAKAKPKKKRPRPVPYVAPAPVEVQPEPAPADDMPARGRPPVSRTDQDYRDDTRTFNRTPPSETVIVPSPGDPTNTKGDRVKPSVAPGWRDRFLQRREADDEVWPKPDAK